MFESCYGFTVFFTVALEANAEKNKYMLSRHQTAGQNHNIKIANRCFQNVGKLKYLGTTVNKSKFDSSEKQEHTELG
jgi:hypothetical protein